MHLNTSTSLSSKQVSLSFVIVKYFINRSHNIINAVKVNAFQKWKQI